VIGDRDICGGDLLKRKPLPLRPEIQKPDQADHAPDAFSPEESSRSNQRSADDIANNNGLKNMWRICEEHANSEVVGLGQLPERKIF
jgi:hypothetical protein